ncbi:MAG: response regulator transcription factor [candidate division Zixibacteria bacterium]|nr:response regulator transcription factor [candidate division Zixibacteria bacterium]
MKQLLVIEDNRVLREGITTKIKTSSDFATVKMSESSTAFEVTSVVQPDLILQSMSLQHGNSISIATELRSKFPAIQMVGINVVPEKVDLLSCVKIGLRGFVLEDASFQDLIQTIQNVLDGQVVLPQTVTDSLFRTITIDPQVTVKPIRVSEAVSITRREQEVIDHVASGLSNKEIAHQLNIATHTVKSHIHNLFEKLALSTRLELIRYAGIYRNQQPVIGIGEQR